MNFTHRKPSTRIRQVPVWLLTALSLVCTVPAVAAGKNASQQARQDEAVSRTSSAQMVYQVLLGEIALQRGDAELASQAYASLALRTRDLKALERAVEVAGHARRFDLAAEIAKLWLEVEPKSVRAQQLLSGVLLMSNQLTALEPQLARMLESDKEALGANLLSLNRMLSRNPDRRAVFRLIEKLCAPYFGIAEAHYATARAAASAGERQRALAEASRALELRNDWEMAAQLEAQLLAQDSVAQGIAALQRFVTRHPGAAEARLQLARALIGEKRFAEARVHFDRLLKDSPNNAEAVFPAAILALQQNDAERAERHLKHLLNLDFSDFSIVHYYLGRIAEEAKHGDTAIEHYDQVKTGEHILSARLGATRILAGRGQFEEARRHLHGTETTSVADRTQLRLAEAQLLRDAKKPAEAFALLEEALTEQPEQPELLYEAAMIAERLNRFDVLEAHLRRLIELQPDSAQAYNALGYSLAERNLRLPEAFELISTALRLSPGDPFILDSMGWILYRQGDFPGALNHLEQAYKERFDPEIAAHLGEVLWKMGRKDEARRTWQEAQKKHPDNEALTTLIKKFED